MLPAGSRQPAPAASLLARCARASTVIGPQRIRHVFLADPKPSPERDAEFGLLVLENGSAGLYYAWLAGEQAELPRRIDVGEIEGADASTVARLFERDSDIERSLGMAAINAITAALYARAGWRPPDAADSFAGLTLTANDRLGMIGNFPPLVRRARAMGIAVHVVEHKPHMQKTEPGLVISLDPRVLRGCNKIICTGATLLNASLDKMLGHCSDAVEVALVGPTVGCFPDDFFARGIAFAAGSEIGDGERAYAALSRGDGLGKLARRTVIDRGTYPGFEWLIERAAARTR